MKTSITSKIFFSANHLEWH